MLWVIVAIVILLWLVAALAAINQLRPAPAAAFIFITGYAFLPVFVDWDIPVKACLTSGMGLLLAIAALRRKKVPMPQLAWWDIPAAVWLGVVIASELANARPGGDVVATVAGQCAFWFVPYVVGRIVLRTPDDFAPAAHILVWVALLLVPLALFEAFTQPALPPLHQILYGQTLVPSDTAFPFILRRWNWMLYRPSLFFEYGQLAASFFFAAGALTQGWLMVHGKGACRNRGMDGLIFLVLAGEMVNDRAYTGILLFIIGAFFLTVTGLTRSRWVLYALLAALPAYIVIRAGGFYKTPFLVNGQYADPLGKNYSIWMRLYNEDQVMLHLHDAPLLGYGSYIRLKWQHTGFDKLEYVDSYWALLLIRTGWLGLIVALQTLLLPLGAAIAALPARIRMAPAAVVLLAVLMLHLVDWSLNTNPSPLWGLLLGGAAALATRQSMPVEIDVIDSRR